MPVDITIAGTTFYEISVSHGSVGNYIAMPPVGNGLIDHGPEYRFLTIPFAGDNTVYTKNLGFLGRDFEVSMCHVGADLDACYALKESFVGQFTGVNPRVSMTWLNGVIHPACILKQGGAVDTGKVFHFSGKTAMVVNYAIRSLELS